MLVKNIHKCRPLVIGGIYVYPGKTVEIPDEVINTYVNNSVGKHFFDTCLIVVKTKIVNSIDKAEKKVEQFVEKVEEKIKKRGRPKKKIENE